MKCERTGGPTDELPSDILARIPADALPAVRQWWADMTPPARRFALTAWDPRREDSFFDPADGDDWDQIPVVIGGRFVPPEQPLVGPEWHADYFEYLLKYPELLLDHEPFTPIGGACTTHPEARAALASGCVPAGFACPLGLAECPLRRLLDREPGRSLRLSGPVLGHRARHRIGVD